MFRRTFTLCRKMQASTEETARSLESKFEYRGTPFALFLAKQGMKEPDAPDAGIFTLAASTAGFISKR